MASEAAEQAPTGTSRTQTACSTCVTMRERRGARIPGNPEGQPEEALAGPASFVSPPRPEVNTHTVIQSTTTSQRWEDEPVTSCPSHTSAFSLAQHSGSLATRYCPHWSIEDRSMEKRPEKDT